jgi:hypothetical protein
LLEDLKKYEDAIKSKNQPMDTESELEYFRERAKALGMDPDDPKNEYGKIIRHGLEDYNPERVLKTCESIFVFPSRALGLPAQMVGLVTATSKYIYCLKHKHWVGGWSLDESYKLFFEKEYCVECNDNIPRENDWKWTSQWQRDMMEKHKEIIEEVDN